MNHRDQSTPSTPSSTVRARARRLLVVSVAAASLGLLSISGMSYANEGFMHGGPAGHMMGMHGAHNEASMEKHLDRMLDRLVSDLSATQKTSIKAIAKAAGTDMKAFHEQRKALHVAKIAILTASTVERNALEQNRVEEMRLAEQMSKRKNLALADAADVLTAAQRAKVGEHLKARLERGILPGTMKSPFSK